MKKTAFSHSEIDLFSDDDNNNDDYWLMIITDCFLLYAGTVNHHYVSLPASGTMSSSVTIVTGGNKGIGFAIARGLSKQFTV